MRAFQVYGECLVHLQFGAHVSGSVDTLFELGLATDSIRVYPRFKHQDVRVDDYGPQVPADVMTLIADALIRMTLIHYDDGVLNLAMAESFGRSMNPNIPGMLAPAGSLMGNGLPLYASGNHFMKLCLVCPSVPVRDVGTMVFPAAYLTEHPVEIPIGTEAAKTVLNWRAIPYKPLFASGLTSGAASNFQEITSSGAILWDTGVALLPGGLF